MSMIISAFPGVGKSHLARTRLDVHDSDSCAFSWLTPGVRHPEFPANYLRHLSTLEGIVLVSSHAQVRAALAAQGFHYWLCYPTKECKEEYLLRYQHRGSPQSFIDLLASKWDEWLTQLVEDSSPYGRIVLGPGQFLSDVDLEAKTLSAQ